MVGVAALSAHAFLIRPWHLRWGATDDEVNMPFSLWRGIFEPAHFILERKVLPSIKQRAENDGDYLDEARLQPK